MRAGHTTTIQPAMKRVHSVGALLNGAAGVIASVIAVTVLVGLTLLALQVAWMVGLVVIGLVFLFIVAAAFVYPPIWGSFLAISGIRSVLRTVRVRRAMLRGKPTNAAHGKYRLDDYYARLTSSTAEGGGSSPSISCLSPSHRPVRVRWDGQHWSASKLVETKHWDGDLEWGGAEWTTTDEVRLPLGRAAREVCRVFLLHRRETGCRVRDLLCSPPAQLVEVARDRVPVRRLNKRLVRHFETRDYRHVGGWRSTER